jgi:putative transposase
MKVPMQSTISQTTYSQSPPSSSPAITDVVLRQIASAEEKKRLEALKRAALAEEKRVEKRQKLGEPQEGEVKKRRETKVYDNPLRARRVRVYPTSTQEAGLRNYFGAVRFCYNLLVEKYRNVGQGGVNLADMRKVVADGPEWLKAIPYDIKDVAVHDFDKARTAHFAKLKKMKQNDPNARHDAKFKFRSKRDGQQSFEVRPRDLTRKTGAMAFLGLGMLNTGEEIPDKAEAAGRFIRDRLGRTFLALPRQIVKRSESQAPSSHESVVALDPGVRTFQTTYDATGLATEWGKGDMKQLFKLCLGADKLQSSWAKKKGAKRRSTKLAWHRVLFRIKNMVKEVHRKMAAWLCESYRVVLIPKFESSRMVKRGGRKIRSKTARGMLTWAHYAFRSMLKDKAELFPWVTIVECDEAYTSKTCGQCGVIHQTLGGAKTFRCKSCGYVADRDISAARNILLRYLSLHCGEGAGS